ncbi:MAG: V-type ATPase subunit, partial [bacterium]
MIENVRLLLKGTLAGRDINDLIAQCHPLGLFRESTMRSIPTFESNAKGYADLYQTVLVDTPVGPYFAKFLQEASARNGGDSFGVIEEVEIEIAEAIKAKNEYLEKNSENFKAILKEDFIPSNVKETLKT